MYVFDNNGFVEFRDFDVDIEDIDLIPENENFFGVNFGTGKLLGAPASEFDGEEGNILLTQEFGGGSSLFILSWDGGNFITEPVTLNSRSEDPGQWEHVTFSPAGIEPIPSIIPPISTDELGHYLFYKLKVKSGSSKRLFGGKNIRFKKLGITLADQFDDENEARYFFVHRATELGNPADKNDEGIQDPETHLVAYHIVPNFLKNAFKGKGKLFRKLPTVAVTNQFGEMTLELWDPPKRLLVPSAKSLVGPVEPLNDPPIDHFQCYGVKKASGFEKLEVSVVDQFEDPKTIELLRPKYLCNPTDKNGEGINNPDQHLVCYTLPSKKFGGLFRRHSQNRREVYVNNQFGRLEGKALGETELCVPSEKAILTEKLN